MASPSYVVHYSHHPSVSFPTEAGMRSYLKRERGAWQPFLDELPSSLRTPISFRHNSQSPESLSSALEILEKHLGNPTNFNDRTASAAHGNGFAIPPASESEEGMLILALFHAGKIDDAVSVYLHFIAVNFMAHVDSNTAYNRMASKGARMLEAASAASVLPFHKVSSAKLAGAARKAENHNKALEKEVARALEINDAHEQQLDELLKEQEKRGKRVDSTILNLNKRRARHYEKWKEKTDTEVAKRFQQAEARIDAMHRANTLRQNEQQSEFERLQDLFATQLRLRAPVKLWEAREASHNKRSNAALLRLFCFGGLTAAIAVAVPWCLGDQIAGSFFEIVCAPQESQEAVEIQCERLFSAKGPLTVTGLLLAMSILTWITRLQYRIHLSERHLSLDASEKKAFAETYLAMKEGEDVGQDNEAIVLASLFRPTQDGIIRDDESGMDLSAVALLAKQLGKPAT